MSMFSKRSLHSAVWRWALSWYLLQHHHFWEVGRQLLQLFWLSCSFPGGDSLVGSYQPMVFTNLTNAVFEGIKRMEQGFHETVWQSTVIKCIEHSSTGIAFVNSFNITFRYITIINCGADITIFLPSQLKRENVCNPSLSFSSTGNITIDNISVQNGSGSDVFLAMDGHDLTISNSLFTHNLLQGNCSVSAIAESYTDPGQLYLS